ncbi:MAG: hypothetical protein JXA73_05555 [Acidobacteria bacterium]|nr:hypothetical protein [Acidobacteriota bacterium]
MAKAIIEILSTSTLLILFIANQANAGINSWTGLGPGGLRVNTLAIDPTDPQKLYAGTEGYGIFKSTDGGGYWSAINTGLTDTRITVLAIDPTTPNTIYAGTQNRGVFKTTNGGDSWNASQAGLYIGGTITSLQLDPIAPQTIYLTTLGGYGVYKSINAGDDWSPSNSGLDDYSVSSLAIDPADPQTLYVAADEEVFKSINGGMTWTASDSGLIDHYRAFKLAVDPRVPTTIYMGTWGFGMFKSMDGGQSWGEITANLTLRVIIALAIDPVDSSTIYAGTFEALFKSTDAGDSWDTVNHGIASVSFRTIAIDPKFPQTLYVGTDGGIFKSTDGGNTWRPINAGLADSIVLSLAIDPSDARTLYAGTYGGRLEGTKGLHKSTDGGSQWFPLSMGWLGAGVNIYDLAIDPINPQNIYATGLSYVFKSTNGGIDWTSFWLGRAGPVYDIRVLAIDPSLPQILYAGSYDAADTSPGSPGGSVYKSTDGGANWMLSLSGMDCSVISVLAVDPQDTDIVYAATWNDGVFKSTDGGSNWFTVNQGLANATVTSLAIDAQNPQTIYAGTYAGVFKTIDGGAMWNTAISGLGDVAINSIAIDPINPLNIYVGTPMSGVFRSTDGGASWSALNEGLADEIITNFAINWMVPQTIYAATYGRGIWAYTPFSDVTVSTNPEGQNFTIDGELFSAAQTFFWPAGGSHTISAIVTPASSGTRHVFASWSDGGDESHAITVPVEATAYTANFDTQYRLTTSVSPQGAGSISLSPALSDHYYASGSFVRLSAIAGSGYAFAGWGFDLTGLENPKVIEMTEPRNVIAFFEPSNQNITITTNPIGRSFVVDGITYTASQTFSWETGSSHTISVATPQGSSDTQYAFASWSDGGAGSHTITVPAEATTYTANFETQYLLTMAVSPLGGGSISASPARVDGYYAGGSTVQISAVPNSGYVFSGWSGDVAGTTNPQMMTMSAPRSVTANFRRVRIVPSRTPPRPSRPAPLRRDRKNSRD